MPPSNILHLHCPVRVRVGASNFKSRPGVTGGTQTSQDLVSAKKRQRFGEKGLLRRAEGAQLLKALFESCTICMCVWLSRRCLICEWTYFATLTYPRFSFVQLMMGRTTYMWCVTCDKGPHCRYHLPAACRRSAPPALIAP